MMALFNRKTIIVVAVLVGLNLWRWWPNNDVVRDNNEAASMNSEVDLRLTDNLYYYGDQSRLPRDLFNYVTSDQNVVARIDSSTFSTENKIKPKVEKRNKTGGAVKSLNSKMRLAGLLFDNEGRYAFILNHETSLSVRVGDVINNRYRVQEITETSVKLYNISTNKEVTLNL